MHQLIKNLKTSEKQRWGHHSVAQQLKELRSVVEVLLAFPGKLVIAEIRLICKAMIFELFLTCGTNCVLAADD